MGRLYFKQFYDSVDDIACDFFKSHSTYDNQKYTQNNIIKVHNNHEFFEFIDMMGTNEHNMIKVVVLYESILLMDVDEFNNSPNIKRLASVKDKLEYVIVCGNQHSLEYLWESDAFREMFSF